MNNREIEEEIKSEFEAYLKKKKISSQLFKAEEPALYEEWLVLFSQVHPKSFEAQKLYLINDIRRRFHIDRFNE